MLRPKILWQSFTYRRHGSKDSANLASRSSGECGSWSSSHSATQSIICVSSVNRPTRQSGPVNSGTLSAIANWRRVGFALSSYFSGQRTDSDFLGLGLTHTAGYARFDLSGSYSIARGVTTYVRVANLFDKAYEDALGYPALGREVRVGMKYRFGGKN